MLSEIQDLEAKTLAPGFWDDRKGAEALFAKLNSLKDSYYPWKELIDSIAEMSELMEIYADEPNNPEEEAQIDEQIRALKDSTPTQAEDAARWQI
jgi:peptide chain release factor 2